MFRFFLLRNPTKAAGLFSDLSDLAEWLEVFEDETAAPTIREIEVEDGIFEVVMCAGRPIGTISHPASAALLDKIQPMRFAWRKFGEAAWASLRLGHGNISPEPNITALTS